MVLDISKNPNESYRIGIVAYKRQSVRIREVFEELFRISIVSTPVKLREDLVEDFARNRARNLEKTVSLVGLFSPIGETS